MSQSSKLDPLPARLRQRSVRSMRRPRHARVVVACFPSRPDAAAHFEPTQFELEAELDAPRATAWTCREAFGASWVQAISDAQCREVVLTAELDDNLAAKHQVLELAELLTHKLAATPLIRVRFLPPSAAGTRGEERPNQAK